MARCRSGILTSSVLEAVDCGGGRKYGTKRDQARYRNGDEAAHWQVREHPDERMLAPFTGHLLRAAALARADRVLDIGCGMGSANPDGRENLAGMSRTRGRLVGVSGVARHRAQLPASGGQPS
jgi:hypothetical protein